MSIATIITRGYGSFGSVNKLPTIGYTIPAAAASVGPLCFQTTLAAPGSAETYAHIPGAAHAMIYAPGAYKMESGCGCG